MFCLHPWLPRSVGFVTLFFVSVIIWGTIYDPEGFWAPGHLSRHHADIESCMACHEPILGTTSQKCMKCHSTRWFNANAQEEVVKFHEGIIHEKKSCSVCHVEHLGILNPITIGTALNPHGEFIFRVTGTSSCSDCHRLTEGKEDKVMPLLINQKVRQLYEEGEGAHVTGQIAQCLSCHRGGQKDIDDEEGDEEDDETEEKEEED